jgi:crotonobetainyl-CoA:carnitine CoA-transferase CaiB-like acyl-CoA transferase
VVREAPRLLAAYRVLDLTGEDGWLCGRLLADLGADVVKVEPPGGDPGRRRGPFLGDEPHPERSLPWLAYNANKRGITLALDSPAGRELFRALVARADFVVESFPPGHLERLGVGYAQLREHNPRVVWVSVTPFGSTGPRSRWLGPDLVVMATSGLMHLVGRPDGPPLRLSVPQAPLWGSLYAAAGALVAHLHRQRTGCGQHVDVSMQASLLSALANAPAYWSLLGEDLRRAGNHVVGRNVHGARLRAIYRCRDGYVNFILYSGEAGRHSNAALVRWMEECGQLPERLRGRDWERFDVVTASQEEIDELEGAVAAFLATQTKAAFSEQALRRGILGYPVADPKDIREDPQLEARGFWEPVEHPELGATVTYPGCFARICGSRPGLRRPAPRVGEHNGEVYGELGLGPQDLARLRAEGVV